MKGLLVCIAVGCLAIANAAPAEESNKQITKHFKFNNNETFSMISFSKEEILFSFCEGSGADQKCWIHLDKLDSYDKLNTSCYIPSLKFSGRPRNSFILINAGNSRAVIALRDGRDKLKLISVNLKGCEIYETSVDMAEIFENEDDGHLDVAIVAHHKNYDVFYKNWKICRIYLCKATIDFEGKVVKAAAVFPLKMVDNEYVNILYVNNGYLVTQIQVTDNVYLIKDGEDTGRILLRDVHSRGPILSSIEENKISLCFPGVGIVMCRQYDVDGKTKLAEFKFETDEGFLDTFAVQNTEKGLILAAIEKKHRTKDGNEWNTFIVGLDNQGKQQKNVKIDLEPNDYNTFPVLYKNSNSQYCAIFVQICISNMSEPPCSHQPNAKYGEFFTRTRCFSETELF